MGMSQNGCKISLIVCNVVLLFVGISVLILGVKMQGALSYLPIVDISVLSDVVMAVIAAGVFISLTGFSGIFGTCYESLTLMITHLVSLGIIIIMEFSLGITLMITKKTVENQAESTGCHGVCVAHVDAIILDYALPSAGLMMTIITIEALMIYSSIRLYFYIRDRPKSNGSPAAQNMQMQNVGQQPTFVATPRLFPRRQMEYMSYQPQPRYDLGANAMQVPSRHSASLLDAQGETSARAFVSDDVTKPPDYDSLSSEQRQRPYYVDSPSSGSASPTSLKETDFDIYPV